MPSPALAPKRRSTRPLASSTPSNEGATGCTKRGLKQSTTTGRVLLIGDGSLQRHSAPWTSRKRRTEPLDKYARTARLGPALLASVPALALLAAGALSPESLARTFGIAAGAIGVAVCGLVRDAGRKLQPRLWQSWGGSPSVRRLRWRENDDA